MKKVTNTDLMKHILTSLHKIISRRTSRNYSVMIITDILKTLEDKFYFLEYVKTKRTEYSENKNDIVRILFNMDDIAPVEIAKSVESIVRIASMNMKEEDAGLYFVKELKDQVEYKYISWLKKNGVDLDLVQIEQHYLYKQKKKKTLLPPSYLKVKTVENDHSSYASLINYTWDKVAFWEYKDNICTIYDKKGKMLDRLPLDKIVKDFLIEMKGFKELPLTTEKLVELNEKEYEFIQLLYSRDMDAETAMQLLHISREELSIIVRKLLVYEVLQYISHDVIMLTEIGKEVLGKTNDKEN